MFEVHALHGFLGKPSDWDFLKVEPFKLIKHDINAICMPSKQNNLVAWGKQFNQTLDPKKKKVLLSYSLGTRLGMQALIQNPNHWKGAILISGNTGLENEKERNSRLEADMVWHGKFKNADSWTNLMEEWNSQSVFGNNIKTLPRNEKDYDRETLANIFKYWSLGLQENLKDQVEQLPIPIFWIAGQNDARYANIAQKMRLKHPLSKVWIAENAAHRVPWEISDIFRQKILTFLHNLQEAYANERENFHLGNSSNLQRH